MDIKKLSARPQLVKFTLDSEELVAKYGEAIDFYSYDRQPMDVFMKLATASQNDQAEMINVMRTMILDSDGKEVINKDETIPADILVAAMQKLGEELGKL